MKVQVSGRLFLWLLLRLFFWWTTSDDREWHRWVPDLWSLTRCLLVDEKRKKEGGRGRERETIKGERRRDGEGERGR